MTRVASDSRLRARATSSRHPLASLSTRTGRALSRSKERLQSARVTGLAAATGAGGGTIVIVVGAAAVLPRSSTALQATLTTPGLTSTAEKFALGPTPEILPAEAE